MPLCSLTVVPWAVTATHGVLPQDVEVDVRVLAVRGNVVEIDRGTNAGAAPGDTVVLRPLAEAEVTGTVRSVSSDTATVILATPSPGLAPGVPGVLRLPRDRFPDPDAAVVLPRPEERPTVWGGRVLLGAYHLQDDGALPRTDSVGRLGLALDGTNPFGLGGRASVALELRSERTDYDAVDLEDDDSTYLRIDQLSYVWGGTRGRSGRFEVGRFLSVAFPELGLLDGVELSYRFDGGARIGTSAGSLVALDRERSFENAPQAALWALVPFGEDDHGELGVALQETWYEGEQDRDLLVSRLRWTDGGAWRADATAWVDLYRSDDSAASEGLDLTEARVGVTRSTPRGAGVRLDLAEIRFPSTRRYRSQEFTPEELLATETTTLSLAAWTPLGARGSLDGRVGVWEDEDTDGGWGDVGYEHRLRGDGIDRAGIGLFLARDRARDVIGARTRVSGPAWQGRWTLGVDGGFYERASTVDAGEEELLQGALRAGWNGGLGRGWSLYLDTALRFGDDQSALSFDFTLQRSF
jgi:hypothetical protein